ncbi:MAG: tRNA (uridine(34)/cytosine(34)/5-carboxymethylaminomethyluridine(34)-2'-O)-methyltransferase TrmL [Bacillota bacterium]
MDKTFNIVLLEPEIPQNTGNIVRTCVCTGARLHLIRPLGFEVTDKNLKRAGLDYWYKADITYYDSYADFLEKTAGGNYYFMTTKGKKRYSDESFSYGDYFIFGKESKGIPEEILKENYDSCLRVPMKKELRSLNLANTVALVAYEAFRQTDFEDFDFEGHLTT